jgi:hypothetical protein
MNTTLKGVVVSTQLGLFGNPPRSYGFIAVQTEAGAVVQVKIDAYTDRDDFKIGDAVQLEVAPLGATDILVVKRLRRTDSSVLSTQVGNDGEEILAYCSQVKCIQK